MKKLFHYCPKVNTAAKEGIKSLSRAEDEALRKYYVRVGSSDREDILRWLESSFGGRSRAVSCLTEKINWHGNDPMLRELVSKSECFSFDPEELFQKDLVEAVWCKDGSEANGKNENFYQVKMKDIDYSPLAWHRCCKEKGMLFGVIRHYMLVLKDGIIPARYLTKEADENKEDE